MESDVVKFPLPVSRLNTALIATPNWNPKDIYPHSLIKESFTTHILTITLNTYLRHDLNMRRCVKRKANRDGPP